MKDYKAKKLLPSRKQGLYYIEHCRVQSKDDRVVYAKQEKAYTKFMSIPHKNTSVILLGSGTSITQAAARKLADEEVMVAFTGGYGTPLFLASQNEYRPTEWMQKWASFWFDEQKRLKVAKDFQAERVNNIKLYWPLFGCPDPSQEGDEYLNNLLLCSNQEDILLCEARYTKNLYRILADHFDVYFVRTPGEKERTDKFNSFLDHGNYLAYGLAATGLWICGIPHSLPVLHGKTRRGALVFDVADIFKDAMIMPKAFMSAAQNVADQDFRNQCVDTFLNEKTLYHIVDKIMHFCDKHKIQQSL